jgi:hypothetical protein
MKYLFIITLSGFLFFTCFAKQGKEASNPNNQPTPDEINLNNTITDSKMKIKIGSDTFTATLYENKTTEALKAILPLTLDMNELNGNEKYGQLSANLPTNTTNIGTIHEGDLLLWGANTLVLFYKTFSTSYKYTKIGRIDNPDGLAKVVGSGNVTITFELE